MFVLRAISVFLCACALLAGSPAQAQQQRTITIGVVESNAASQTLAKAICALINSGSPEHGILCSTPVHADAIENLEALKTGQQTMAIVMSDLQSFAYEGRERFDGQPFEDMRSVFSAQPQAFTLLARKAAGIATLDDLKNRHVNVGNSGSPQRLLMNAVLSAKGWSLSDFASTLELKAEDQVAALCDGKTDAVVFASIHPDPLVQQAFDTCDIKMVPAAGEDIIRLIDNSSHFTEVVIPAGTYKSLGKEVVTFGLRSTLVASKNTDQTLVYDVVKIIFQNFDKLRKLDASFNTLDELEMTRSGLTAPLHPGALRYFREEDLH